MTDKARPSKKLPPGLVVGFETQVPVVKPKGLPKVPPADAKLELVPEAPTLQRARGGAGIASRSLKRSSANKAVAKSSGTHSTSPAPAKKATGKQKAAKLDDGSTRRRRNAGAATASLGAVGALVALPIIAIFGIGLLVLVNKNTAPPPATTAPAATAAPTPRPAAPSKPAAPQAEAAAPEAARPDTAPEDAPAPTPRRPGNALEAGEDAMSADEAKLARERERELLEAERRMIEEREARANGGAPTPKPAEPEPSEPDPAPPDGE